MVVATQINMWYNCIELYTAKSFQSCPTLCDPIDGSPPGSPFLGILQARTLEWFAMSFSNAGKWKVKMKSLCRVLATPWTTAYQAPPSMGFSRQEYWSGVPLPSPRKIYTHMKISVYKMWNLSKAEGLYQSQYLVVLLNSRFTREVLWATVHGVGKSQI